jgi:hypothetical protein
VISGKREVREGREDAKLQAEAPRSDTTLASG